MTNRNVRLPSAALILAVVLGCRPETTAKLDSTMETRLTNEGIVRRADDQAFRFSFASGSRSAGWEERRASIIVTHSTVLIHKNDKVGIEITPATARRFSVERTGTRVRIRSGEGKSSEIWSFEPAGDAAGWTADIRAVIRAEATPSGLRPASP
ncbi:MAG: hypothetical protein ABI637_04345 [Gemmatimonadota bacterium]